MPLLPSSRKLKDQGLYQTVHAKKWFRAAPTAGLHFTDDLLAQIKAKGVNIAWVTLHVGLGTFRPVSVDNIEHDMHSEFYILPEETADIINAQIRANVMLGTTSTALESVAQKFGKVKPIATGRIFSLSRLQIPSR